MITTILSDFSNVILFAKEKKYSGTLNNLNKDLTEKSANYNFYDYFEFNEELLSLYRKLKNKYSINLFTKGTIQNLPEVKEKLGNLFDSIFSSLDLNINKNDPSSYSLIARKLGKNPSEILFIDDMIKNIEAAKKAGLATIHYTDYPHFSSQIKSFI